VAQDRLSQFRGRTYVIVSYHNFEATPMDTVVNRVMKVQADAYKIVTTARKPSDNVRLAAAKALPKHRMIVLAMGELGFPTRVLSPFSAASIPTPPPMYSEGTAAGQVSSRFLRHLYRVEKLGKSARSTGDRRAGTPLHFARRAQPQHFNRNAWMRSTCPSWTSPHACARFLLDGGQASARGFSVTIPHKQKIIRYWTWWTRGRIGAVTPSGARPEVARHQYRRRALPVRSPACSRSPTQSVLIVGNGGAARSAAHLRAFRCRRQNSLVGRNADRVRALSKICGAESLLKEQLDSHHFDAVVHATPLGMFPHVNECFFEDKIPAEIVFDMVYNPLETVLVKHAKEQGKTVVPGLDMFIEQAVRQFEIWTGETAPRSVMQKAAIEALSGNGHAPPPPPR
jgi:3-dehydroquinate dehydratase/shikimate dehydrogenase